MSQASVVLFGGSGFVGRHVAAKLVQAGYEVKIPCRRRERVREDLLVLPGVSLVDVPQDREAWLALCQGASALINLVGILHGRAVDFCAAHVDVTRLVIDVAQTLGIRRVLHMSALGASVEGPSLYLRTKGQAEALIQASGLDWTCFRPSVIFGRDDQFLNLLACLQRVLPVLPLAGAQVKFQPVWVEDVARAMVQSLRLPATVGQTLELVGPEQLTLAEIAQAVGRWQHTVRPVLAVPDALARPQAWLMERLPKPLLSRDNLDSMLVDNIGQQPFPSVLGFAPAALRMLGPTWIGPAGRQAQLDRWRAVRVDEI